MKNLMSIMAKTEDPWRRLGKDPENPWKRRKSPALNFLEKVCFLGMPIGDASNIDKMLKEKTQDFLR